MNFRGNSDDNKFVGKFLEIYRGRSSSEYFDGIFDGPILGSSDETFLGIFIGNFRGTWPSENSEESVALGNFRGRVPRPPVELPSGSPRQICDLPCPSAKP
ncbi:hypothetical protein DY000_02002669 [Brassica cretica]|uniref:Jacalin-type lectin domain-containing protein n=1 Tax=Brassica cretica TaxID=69181 RepID=A0ABQ7CIM2_BRACR|nr:hypothetical protein DY000_02002669 [Brassica cretica]